MGSSAAPLHLTSSESHRYFPYPSLYNTVAFNEVPECIQHYNFVGRRYFLIFLVSFWLTIRSDGYWKY